MAKGKRAEDLPLDEQPMRRPAPKDLRDADWFQFQSEIANMLSSGRYDWAEDTLTGISETVEKYQTVTEGQRRAVENIRSAGDRRRRDGFRARRYEGYKRWNR